MTEQNRLIFTGEEWDALEIAVWGKCGNTLEVSHSQRIQSAVEGIINRRTQALRASLTAVSAEKEKWQPIETAPPSREVWFWIRPRTADETYYDGSGEPILAVGCEPKLYRGFRKRWGALWTATHWREIHDPLPPASDAERATTSDVSSGPQAGISQLRKELVEVSRRLAQVTQIVTIGIANVSEVGEYKRGYREALDMVLVALSAPTKTE